MFGVASLRHFGKGLPTYGAFRLWIARDAERGVLLFSA
jgi:hypothetical protein